MPLAEFPHPRDRVGIQLELPGEAHDRVPAQQRPLRHSRQDDLSQQASRLSQARLRDPGGVPAHPRRARLGSPRPASSPATANPATVSNGCSVIRT